MCTQLVVAGLRIIPARAGFTTITESVIVERRDHPRSRGVYTNPSGAAGIAQGSSPLARGLLYSITIISKDGGIIPARAGFTAQGKPIRIPTPDHPRSRGVYCRPLPR